MLQQNLGIHSPPRARPPEAPEHLDPAPPRQPHRVTPMVPSGYLLVMVPTGYHEGGN